MPSATRVYGKRPPKEDYKFECIRCKRKFVGQSFLKEGVCVVCKIEEDNRKAIEEAKKNKKKPEYVVVKSTSWKGR